MMAAQEAGPEYRTGAAVAANGGCCVAAACRSARGLHLVLRPAKRGVVQRVEASYRFTRPLRQRDRLAGTAYCVAVLHALSQRALCSAAKFHDLGVLGWPNMKGGQDGR